MTGPSTAPLWWVAMASLALTVPLGPASWVSLSAPCFVLLAIERLARPQRFLLGLPGLLAALFLVGCGLSLAAGLWSGRTGAIAADEALLLVRFCFWVGVFLLTADGLAQAPWASRLGLWAAGAGAAVAALRLADALYGGGLHAELSWLSRNAYGERFSLFAPFVAAAAVGAGRRSALWTGALLLLLGAVMLNGSRSAWITVLAGLATVLAVHALAGRLRLRSAAAAVAAVAVCAALPLLGPAPLRAKLQTRLATFTRLDQDKPVRTRQLLLEKGLRHFAARPWTGLGIGRFSKTEVRVVTAADGWLTDRDLNQRSAHNGYVKILAETGLAGTVPLAGLLVFLAIRGLPAAVRLTWRGEGWAAGAYASFVAVSLHMWTLSGLTGTGPWFCFGLLAAAILRDQRGPA